MHTSKIDNATRLIILLSLVSAITAIAPIASLVNTKEVTIYCQMLRYFYISKLKNLISTHVMTKYTVNILFNYFFIPHIKNTDATKHYPGNKNSFHAEQPPSSSDSTKSAVST